MPSEFAPAESPEGVSRQTQDVTDAPGDAADQAERLTMVMEAEALRNALRGNGDGEGSLEGYDLPLADTESELAEEDAEDASDDPMHAGGVTPRPWMGAENAAMRVVNEFDPDGDSWADDETRQQREDADFDQFDEPQEHLTPEDETLLGIDPYE